MFRFHEKRSVFMLAEEKSQEELLLAEVGFRRAGVDYLKKLKALTTE
jgi:hypothetical protein